ncbi:MAG TPA: DUF2877 domain-containing protein [Anaerolineales bacterium]|nr:DUF2877 domain-containing protein [Anaerolineales bacterium]
MQTIKALSLTQNVNEWLANTLQPRILHVFDNVCNLLNEQKEVLSIVVQQIGNGPFNLVVEDDILFSKFISLESPVFVSPTQLILGDLSINTVDANLWNPRPDWEGLHAKRADILKQIPSLRAPKGAKQSPTGKVPTNELEIAYPNGHRSSKSASALLTLTEFPDLQFSDSLARANISAAIIQASKLAGLGQGLTPAADDYIMGALHAVWIIHPREVALKLGNEIAEIAAPLTTSLSAAWIRSAGRGKSGEIWHRLFDALISGEKVQMTRSLDNILAVGETSGADALAGFIGVCSAAKERMYN